MVGVLVALPGAGGGDVGWEIEVDDDDGERGHSGAQDGGGGQVTQAVEDEGLPGAPAGSMIIGSQPQSRSSEAAVGLWNPTGYRNGTGNRQQPD
jgi:hypothetical protein